MRQNVVLMSKVNSNPWEELKGFVINLVGSMNVLQRLLTSPSLFLLHTAINTLTLPTVLLDFLTPLAQKKPTKQPKNLQLNTTG